MAQVQYITREFIPRVDLTTLGNTFNTLEQGHQAAVQAASDLKATVAALPMNAQEDGFKEKLVNEINQTVDDNTLYGNSYGALDNLVEQIGNIQSDGRIIGRVRNHQAKVEYDAKVDAMAIPDGMKQMYKEENPYYYEDGEVDANTGRVLPGEKWKAKTNPVTTVPLSEIQKYALQIAAKDAGSGEAVSFLDANGNPTPDPSQSEDGLIYKKVGKRWEALTKDKIREAYRVAIDTIPGAKDSINQDYKYEVYKYDKLVQDAKQKGGDVTPFVQGLTDKEGNLYTQDRWLNNIISDFADVSSYSHVYSTVDYGGALAARAERRKAARSNDNGAPAGDLSSMIKSGVIGANRIGDIAVEKSNYTAAVQTKDGANRQVLNTIKNVLGSKALRGVDSVSDLILRYKNKNGSYGPNSLYNNIMRQYGNRFTPQQKLALKQGINGYYNSNRQISKMIKSTKNRDGLLFSANMNTENYTKDNKYGQGIIEQTNGMFKNGGSYIYTLGTNVLNSIKSYYNVDNLNKVPGLIVGTDNDGNVTVTFNASNKNYMAKFQSYAKKADADNTNWSLWNWGKKQLGLLTDDSYTIKTTGGASNFAGYRLDTMSPSKTPAERLGDIYDKGVEAASKAEKSIGINKNYINVIGTSAGSIGEIYWKDIGAKEGLSRTDIDAKVAESNNKVKEMIGQGALDAGLIYSVDAAGRFNKDVTNAQKLAALSRAMANGYKEKVNIKYVPAQGNTRAMATNGYYMVFDVPADAKEDALKPYAGKQIKLYYGGTIDEGYNYNPGLNATHVAKNNFQIAKATRTNVENLGYNNHLGDTSITNNGNNKYSSNFLGTHKNLNEAEAEQYAIAVQRLEDFKSEYHSGLYANETLAVNTLLNISNYIANITGNSPQITFDAVLDYVNDTSNYE